MQNKYPKTYERARIKSLLNREEIQFPQTEKEIFNHFFMVYANLEPESLYCDGECTQAEAQHKANELYKEWNELEEILGREVDSHEVELKMFQGC